MSAVPEFVHYLVAIGSGLIIGLFMIWAATQHDESPLTRKVLEYYRNGKSDARVEREVLGVGVMLIVIAGLFAVIWYVSD